MTWPGRFRGTVRPGRATAVTRDATERHIRVLRLDTRSDLTEACILYERLGFDRVAAFNAGSHSDRWYLKPR